MAVEQSYERRHIRNLAAYKAQIDEIFKEATREAASIGVSLKKVNPDRPFTFADYPQTRKRVDGLIKSIQRRLSDVIVDGVKAEWALANEKNSSLVMQVYGESLTMFSQAEMDRLFSSHEKAQRAFLDRKELGLNLSDRVWKYTGQFKDEIEMGLDVGISEGRSAELLSRDLRGYLQHPDTLFRRVRDKRGVLHLSQAAKAYHPGQGVYRSAYKNALRLAGTETNIAYRTADYLATQEQDFVVGIRIETSKTNHTTLDAKGRRIPLHDICDELAGDYPKDFKFTGWHPNCRCHVIKIQKTVEEIAADNERILRGEKPTTESKNTVKGLPASFTEWAKANSERIKAAKTLPYFIKDNKELISRCKANYNGNVMVSIITDGTIQPTILYNSESGGGVTANQQRVTNALKNKNEREKFIKEYNMCKVLADAGYEVELLEETPGISSPDIKLNGVPAELKKMRGTSKNIEKYGRKAARRQGAKLVVFEFNAIQENVLRSIKILSSEGIHGLFFKTGDPQIHTF